MKNSHTCAHKKGRCDRANGDARALKATTIRPARQGDLGSIPIPAGSMVIETQLAPGVRHRRLVTPDGEPD